MKTILRQSKLMIRSFLSSAPAVLTVAAVLLAGPLLCPAALVVHFPYDNLAATNSGTGGPTYDGVLFNGTTLITTDSILGNGSASFDSSLSSYIAHGPSPISGTQDRTLSLWTKNTLVAADGQRSVIAIGNGENGAPNGGKMDIDLDASGGPAGVGRVEIGVAGGRTAPNYASPGVNSNVWSLVTVTWSASRGAGLNGARIYVNGQFVYAPGAATPAINTGNGGFNDFFVGKSVNSLIAFPGIQQYYKGLLDDVSVWSVNLSDTEVLALYQVATEPALKYDAGDFAALKALHDAASGSVTIGARTWSYATNLLTTAGLTNTAAGHLLVFNAANGTGVANWSATPPQMLTQPVSQTNAVGSAATFSAFALGQQPLAFQWYFNSNPLEGATASSLTRDPVQLADGGSYFVVVTNIHGATTSSVVSLTVVDNTPPFITANPTNVTVVRGQPVTLEAAADGSPPLSFQWRSDGAPMSGATTNPLHIPSAAYSDAGNWDLVVTNSFGAATSQVAVVTVLDVTAPLILNVTNIIVAPTGPSGTIVSLSHIIANDDRDGVMPVILNPPGGSLFPPGATVVSALAADAAGNQAKTYFTVTVLATVPWQTNFLDTFTVSANSTDLNFEYDAVGRQSGVLSPLPYAESIATAVLGQQDAFSQVEHPSYPGKLYLSSDASTSTVVATPANNFVESATFAIEFEVQPPIEADANLDWAAVSWGAVTANRFPNETTVSPINGMGVLFRGSPVTNEIVFFQGATTLHRGYPYYEGTGLEPLPSPPYNVRIEVYGSAFGDGSPALVRTLINGRPVRISDTTTNEFHWIKTNGFAGNLINLAVFRQVGLAKESAFDNFRVTALPSIWPSRTAITTIQGSNNQAFDVVVPPSLVATSLVTVVISNAHPAVASLAGEVGGLRTLTFNAGGPNRQSVTVIGQAVGDSTFTLNTTAGVPIGRTPVSVKVIPPPLHIANPSFEEPPIPGFPGSGAVTGWAASEPEWIGLSPNLEIGGALANNSFTLDGSYAAILRSVPAQGFLDTQLSTTISNLAVGQVYQLSFRANAGAGGATTLMDVVLDGASALSTRVAPVGFASLLDYKPVSLVFTAAASTVSLAISNQSPAVAEGRLLVDSFGVQAISGPLKWSIAPWTGDEDSGVWSTNTYTHAYNFGRAENILINGISFTGIAGGNPSVNGRFVFAGQPTQLQNAGGANTPAMTGESFNLAKDFIYNGQNPTLTLQGLTAGAKYRFKLFGFGFGATPYDRVSTFTAGGQSITVDEGLFGQGQGIILNYDFTATGSTEVITWRVVGGGTYHTAGFANQLVELPVTLTITQVSPTQVRIAWPAAATGYELYTSPHVGAGYASLGVAPAIEGNESVVYQTISGSRYYRLVKP